MDVSSATSALHRPGRGRVFDSIVDAIGDTPIVRLRQMPQAHGARATILAKLEYFNPAASVNGVRGNGKTVTTMCANKNANGNHGPTDVAQSRT